MLGVPKSQSGRCEEEKNISLAGNGTPVFYPVFVTDRAIPIPKETITIFISVRS
jgi:hypothetical protein